MRSKLLAVAVMIAGIAVAWHAPSAAAAPNDLTAELVEFPTFLGPDGVLRIGIQLTNGGSTALTNLRMSIEIHEGVGTRSQLDRTFRGSLGPLVGSDTIGIEGSIEAGRQRLVFAEKSLSEISFFRSVPEDRTYPVRITVRSGRSSSEAIDTHMIFFAKPPVVPLGLTLVLPIHQVSVYQDPLRPEEATSASLERSYTSGDIKKLLDEIEEHPQTSVTLAPSGLFLDTLSDLADGFVRRRGGSVTRVSAEDGDAKNAGGTLQKIRRLTTSGNLRVVTMPYSNAFLPALVRAGLGDRAQRQITAAEAALSGGLEVDSLEGWMLAPTGGLDERTLSELQRSGVSRIITGEETLRKIPRSLTRGLPVQLEVRTGTPVTALVADRGLGARLAPQEELGVIQARQRFLAETATIMLERPAQRRIVTAVAPVAGIDPSLAEGVLGAIGTAPWLKPTTPDQVVQEGLTAEKANLAPAEEVVAGFPDAPGTDYFAALKDARRAIDRYADLAPPESRLVQLDRRLLIAESADWWTSRSGLDRGTRFANSVVSTVEGEMNKIRAPISQTITLTSRNGVIPLSISSALGYPVDVVVRLDSDKLRFPEGEEIRIDQLRAPNRIVKVGTVARATGTFPLRVVIQTPNSRIQIAESRLIIRSTAYNVVAVSITAGAGIFLVGWWVVGSIRKRLPA